MTLLSSVRLLLGLYGPCIDNSVNEAAVGYRDVRAAPDPQARQNRLALSRQEKMKNIDWSKGQR